uniref:Uncharacterized protein n=1 Tax=Arundo donax TaxID=35708 RepID=A0A0A8XSV9_ARUDO
MLLKEVLLVGAQWWCKMTNQMGLMPQKLLI